MKFWVSLQGRDAEVEFEARDGKVFLEVEGRSMEADFVRLPDGEVYSLLVDGRSHEVSVSHRADGLDVSVDGVSMPVEVRSPLEKLLAQTAGDRAKGRGETITAPMPGAVVAIHVKPGDVVHAGQAVVVLEAMKMQNELAAQSGGVVSEVHVSVGAAVASGAVLVQLQPESAS
jgi:biotin carboxyl carrier protein